ncbi:hypothetical protein Gotur_014062 [Gossypium turneri]
MEIDVFMSAVEAQAYGIVDLSLPFEEQKAKTCKQEDKHWKERFFNEKENNVNNLVHMSEGCHLETWVINLETKVKKLNGKLKHAWSELDTIVSNIQLACGSLDLRGVSLGTVQRIPNFVAIFCHSNSELDRWHRDVQVVTKWKGGVGKNSSFPENY